MTKLNILVSLFFVMAFLVVSRIYSVMPMTPMITRILVQNINITLLHKESNIALNVCEVSGPDFKTFFGR